MYKYNKKIDLVNDIAGIYDVDHPIEYSTRKNKKFMTLYNNKRIHFGEQLYFDYLDHKDKRRRDSYLARAKQIMNKDRELTYLLRSSPNFYSFHLLWPTDDILEMIK